jgi:hemerythrin
MMDIPSWSDFFALGHDAIDSSHRDIMLGLARVQGAVRAQDYRRAEQWVEALSDACSIHAQSEDETFVGFDHDFPHETFDELLTRLRAGVCDRNSPERALAALQALGQALLSDIHADRSEMARLAEGSPWRRSSSRWLSTLPA